MRGQVFPRGLRIKFVMLRDGLDGLKEIRALAFPPRSQRPVVKLERRIRHHELLVKEKLDPQPVTIRAGPERRVERKKPRLDLGNCEATDRTGKILREGQPLRLPLLRRCLQYGDTVSKVERGAKTVGQPRLKPVFHHNPVHHHINVVPEFLVKRRRLVQLVEGAVHLHPLKALLAQLKEFLAVFALPVAHDGGQKKGACALVHGHHPIHHVLHLLRFDGLAGGRAIGRARPREQKTHVVIDFRHGANGRTGVLAGGLLLDGNRRAQAADMVHIRLFHHIEELPRIGAEALDIAPLPLGRDRIESEARFTGPAEAGNHHKFIARNVHVDALEIVLARAAHLDMCLLCHVAPSAARLTDSVSPPGLQWKIENISRTDEQKNSALAARGMTCRKCRLPSTIAKEDTMHRTRRAFIALTAGFLAAPAMAHHGWRWTDSGEFELTGIITEADLGNPHGVLTIDAEGEIWTAEVGQPWRNERAGLTDDMMAPGTEITIQGERSADPDERLVKAEAVVIDGTRYILYEGRV